MLERFSRLFTGLTPVRLPVAWHILKRLLPGGSEIAYVDDATGGHTVHTDRVFITECEPVPEAMLSQPG